jgi:hypothetical protein
MVSSSDFLQPECKDFGNNIEKMLLARKCLLDDIQPHRDVFHEDLLWVLKCLERVQQLNIFAHYFETVQNKWEEGYDYTPKECRGEIQALLGVQEMEIYPFQRV